MMINYLVGGWTLPLWKMMEWVKVSWDDFPFHSQLFLESHNPVMFQSPFTPCFLYLPKPFTHIYPIERWWKMNSIDSDANAWPTNMFPEKNHERFLGIPPKRSKKNCLLRWSWVSFTVGIICRAPPQIWFLCDSPVANKASTKQEWLIAKFAKLEGKKPASLTKPDQTAVCSGIHVVVGYLRSNLPMFSLASFLRSTSPTPSKKNVEMCSNSEG